MSGFDVASNNFSKLRTIEKKIDNGIMPSKEEMEILNSSKAQTTQTKTKLVDNTGKPISLKKGNLQQDTFETNKPKEKSFFEKHKKKLGIAGVVAGPIIAFGGVAAALTVGVSMMPAIVVGGLIGMAGLGLATSK